VNTDFLKFQAQTSPYPLGITVSRAQGSFVYDTQNKAYLDFVAGVSACTLGHCHPEVVAAIQQQTQTYMHVMVYGEFALEPAVTLCKELAQALPPPLEQTYLVNSGTEAIEGAIKLARRVTGRYELISANEAYHGNTMGSLSLMNYESRLSPFRPLLPGISHIHYNNFSDLAQITTKTAGVILETIQGGAGFILPENGYLEAVRKRCNEVGALLILDEIQPGFGRTGALFSFEHFKCTPDILVMGKGMASGLPIGAFTASLQHMNALSQNPKLGHITTFGGNPVVAAAALATLRELQNSNLISKALEKEALFRELLVHPLIEEVRGKGLMLALIFKEAQTADYLILKALSKGLLLFWLLFEPRAVRISPPLTLSMEEIQEGCAIILEVLNDYSNETVH
jgi:acetylornithine/succinyldiaminopimelate/putrescine aminotransferase